MARIEPGPLVVCDAGLLADRGIGAEVVQKPLLHRDELGGAVLESQVILAAMRLRARRGPLLE